MQKNRMHIPPPSYTHKNDIANLLALSPEGVIAEMQSRKSLR